MASSAAARNGFVREYFIGVKTMSFGPAPSVTCLRRKFVPLSGRSNYFLASRVLFPSWVVLSGVGMSGAWQGCFEAHFPADFAEPFVANQFPLTFVIKAMADRFQAAPKSDGLHAGENFV